LSSGKVLVAGGSIGSAYLNGTELFDPATNTWTTTASLASARANHTATPLFSGKVLVAGGYNGSALASAELYTPAATNGLCAQATVYRYRNELILGHFYTTSTADGAARIAAGEPLVYEGAAFNACSGGNKSDGIYPVYRFKHLLQPSVYFYTMLESELTAVRTSLTSLLHEEGIAYYAYNFQPAGTFPVYRFRNIGVPGANFYTISESEKANIIANVPGYPYEGIGFWAMPPGP
jgi:hypothetical protein